MSRIVNLAQLTWPEYAEELSRNAVVMVPCGATEQHGPHLPLGVDAYLSAAIARDVARDLGALVAPVLSYGYRSMPRTGGGPFFPGTTNLNGATLSSVVCDVVSEFARHGAKRICLIDGHLENQWFLTEGIHLATERIRDPDVTVVRLEYWDLIDSEALQLVFPDGLPDFALEHAAVMETSLMLHYHPDLVRKDLVPDGPPAKFRPLDRFPPTREGLPPTGSLTTAAGATAEKGRILASAAVRNIVAELRAVFGDKA